ncbi:hypothetical protein OS188_07575 [Xanthomarina sp. F1114]|uniref:AOC03_06830 family ribosome hibernation factor n=1 Tax=Xanthomarina sp. F1114 TaxID=2996019 RepID=UPI00225DF673|nr:hypothetical protein [Xanthomarina sp. F1114]MCX7547808.1 hypothetical protein [Xanthomarina sp. F1114]
MNTTLKQLKNIRSENCISIILNTHRTKPDYLKDALQLKNLIKDAENRLMADTDKKTAQNLVKRLKDLAEQIDHSQNLESLILFVNKNTAEYTRLPISVVNRVVIDDTFATRDLIRAMHIEANYYVLVLSQEKVRLIEASNNKVVKEFGNPFPMDNKQEMSRSQPESSLAARQTNLIAEFFNQVDKELNHIRHSNPLPVFICSLEENYSEYLKIADQKQTIFEVYLNKNQISHKNHDIVSEAWRVIEEYLGKQNNKRKAELEKAVTENKFLSDTNEIWKAITEGKIQTLFIEQGLFQPAIMENDEIIYVSEDQRSDTDVIDDIYDELIEYNMSYGGDVVFLPKGELTKFNGFGAITRY